MYERSMTRSWERYLRESAVSREVIDAFLQRPHWATFDPELGYTLHNSFVQAGVDESRTIETFRPDGARSRFLYAGRKPRSNTYGNSFTEGNQVSDGETWQEYLAGHFGEPVGNFGVGVRGSRLAGRDEQCQGRGSRCCHGAEAYRGVPFGTGRGCRMTGS